MTSTDPTSPDATHSRSELVAALPTVRRLTEELHQAVLPALVTGESAPEAEAIDQAATAISWVADALGAPTGGDRIERLTEAANRAGYVIQAMHRRLAGLQSVDALAAAEANLRQLGIGIGMSVVDGARLNVVLDEDGTTATVTLTVTPDGHLEWTSPDSDLAAVDGEVHLAVTRALDQLAGTITTALVEE